MFFLIPLTLGNTPGWHFDPAIGIDLAREAVESTQNFVDNLLVDLCWGNLSNNLVPVHEIRVAGGTDIQANEPNISAPIRFGRFGFRLC